MRFFSILLAIPLTQAWYKQIHNQITLVSEPFLSSRTQHLISSLLGPRFNGSIGSGAGWADTIRPNASNHSFRWHYVGMHEDVLRPDPRCEMGWTGVCEDQGCVSGQITNQSRILGECFRNDEVHGDMVGLDARARSGTSIYSLLDCQQALLWVVHFIADIAQPLHTSSTAEGGNGIAVRWNGTQTNLHSVWDQWIVYLAAGRLETGFSADVLDEYFEGMQQDISGVYAGVRDEWTSCLARKEWLEVCPRVWAEEAHALVCESVYSRQFEDTTDVYIDGYGGRMTGVAELQMARAAWRTAAWLNALVERLDVENSEPKLLKLQA